MAAECIQDQGGDNKYFEYHDKIYAETPGNGQGLSTAKLAEIASEIGLEAEKLKECLKDKKFKDEVAQDAADAAKVGINGTPGFVIGKLSDDGRVEGKVISGAQPFSVFKEIIESELSK